MNKGSFKISIVFLKLLIILMFSYNFINANELLKYDDNILFNLVKFYAQNGDIERALIELKRLQEIDNNPKYKQFEEILRTENEKWNKNINSTKTGNNNLKNEKLKDSYINISYENVEDNTKIKENEIIKGRLRYVYELLSRGEKIQAIAKLHEIINLNPNTYEAITLLGELYLTNKNFQDAINIFQKALKIRQDAEINYKLGVCYKALNDIENAIIYFNNAVRMNPKHEFANLNLGNIWRFKKNFKLAKNYYEQALKANPKLAEAHLGMADCIYNEGNIDEATKAYAYIVTNFPSEYSGYLGLARILINNQQFKEAKATILKAREIAPNNSQVYEMLGILAYYQKDNKQAIENFKKAIILDSKNLTAYQSLINILIDEKKYDEALVQIKSCLAKFPNEARLYYLSGIIYSGFKNNTLALKNLEQAYKLDPENIEVIIAIAILHENSFKYKLALEKYREALLLSNEKKDNRYIAHIHKHIEELEKKVEKFEKDYESAKNK